MGTVGGQRGWEGTEAESYSKCWTTSGWLRRPSTETASPPSSGVTQRCASHPGHPQEAATSIMNHERAHREIRSRRWSKDAIRQAHSANASPTY